MDENAGSALLIGIYRPYLCKAYVETLSSQSRETISGFRDSAVRWSLGVEY
jgi:hypothetical protein